MADNASASPPLDRAAIVARLAAADAATLLMSLIHLSGDLSLLEGPYKPAELSAENEADIRTRVADLLASGEAPRLAAPDEAQLSAMARLFTGTTADAGYGALLQDQLNSGAGPDGSAPAGLDDYPVLVIGAGVSGLLAARRLKEAGFPYLLVDRNAGLGGTLYQNRYPGCRVDAADLSGPRALDPAWQWSSPNPPREEVLARVEQFAEAHGLRDSLALETTVETIAFDEAGQMWVAGLRKAGGGVTERRFRAVFCCVGPFSEPFYPDVPWREKFQGVSLHTGHWDPAIDLSGKHVAVVGTGCSALQLVPEIVDQVASLVIFQRSPPWLALDEHHAGDSGDALRWVMQHVPFYAQWHWFGHLWHADSALPELTFDPAWKGQPETANARNAQMAEDLRSALEARLGDNPALLAKLTPEYPPRGKRLLRDDGRWLAALQQPHVELSPHRLSSVNEGGIRNTIGHQYDVDVLIYATGTKARFPLSTIAVRGRGGQSLRELWGETPRAHLGMTVPGFPNLFLVHGPGTELPATGAGAFAAECRVRYAVACLSELAARGEHTLEVRKDAYEAYVARYADAADRMVMASPLCSSFFLNRHHQVINAWPWRLVDLWDWTAHPDFAAFSFSRERSIAA